MKGCGDDCSNDRGIDIDLCADLYLLFLKSFILFGMEVILSVFPSMLRLLYVCALEVLVLNNDVPLEVSSSVLRVWSSIAFSLALEAGDFDLLLLISSLCSCLLR